MKSLFDPSDRETIRARLAALQPDSARQWGKMNVSQMLAHCATALEIGTGERPTKQKLIGKLLAPLVRKSVLGETPFGKNGPTDKMLVVADERDFNAERGRLLADIERFAERGTANAGAQMHPFFGKLSGDDWGTLMYKHIDHHLRQFGA